VATWKTVQKIMARLPETEEGTSYGTPAFKVKGKFLVRLREDSTSLVVPTSEKAALLADDRDVFFTTPHYDGHPSILVRLPKVSEKELRELLTDAWRIKAPPKVLKAHTDV
jgi:hypothetical protein